MSISPRDQRLNEIAEEYAQQGYVVNRAPDTALPFPTDGYRPALIAHKGASHLAVEVATTTSRLKAGRYIAIADETAKHPGWQFLLATVDDVEFAAVPTTEQDLPRWEQLLGKFRNAKALEMAGYLEASLLQLGGVLEAGLRRRALEQHLPFERFPVRRLLDELYTFGEVPISHFKALQAFLCKRERLMHGAVETEDLAYVCGVANAIAACLATWHTPDEALRREA